MPSVSAARYRFRPGRMRSSIATRPVLALKAHQPLTPGEESRPAAYNRRSAGAANALIVGDGGVSDTVRDCVTAAVVFAGMVILRALQFTPKGNDPVPAPAAGQVIATVPVNPPLGVTVIGIVTVFGVVPAVAVIGLPSLTMSRN